MNTHLPLHLGALAICLTAALGAVSTVSAEETIPLIEYPYVSIYHTEPTVAPGEKVKVRYYMTDWNHSLVRFGDDTKRFDAMVKYGPVGGPYSTVTNLNLASGDHEIEIGPFERGDYVWSVWVRDRQNGLESNRILHDVRVRSAADLAITEAQTYRMTEADLTAYGIVPEREGRYRVVLVDTPTQTNVLDATNIPAVDIPDDGYVSFAPADNGKLRIESFKYAYTVYGPNWNSNEVAVVASNNNVAIQRFIDDKKAAGFKKLVLLPRRFRVSHTSTIIVPTELTLDMNGATFKLNGFKGSSCQMMKILDAYDSHLVNGTIEGDYYEHDYSEYAEWVNALAINGSSRYSSFENMVVSNITGYGSTVHMDGASTCPGCKTGGSMFHSTKCKAGAIDLRTGELDTSAVGRYASDWVDLICFSNVDRFCVSHYIDPIRGRVSRSWYMTIAFYDENKSYLCGETTFLYRDLLIPPGARYARVTAEFTKPDNSLTLQTFRIPSYCAVRDNRFFLNRSTAHVPFVCRELLTERNDFGYCGEACTHCAIDTEDGWEGLHDFYLRDNVFHDTPNADVIVNSGVNLVVERNVATISIRARAISPCIRDNISTRVNFLCGVDTTDYYPGHEKTMCGRYENNTITESLKFGDYACSDGWTIAMTGSLSGTPEQLLSIKQGASGVFREMAFTNCTFEYSHVNFEGCSFVNCKFTYPSYTGKWKDCTFDGAYFNGATGNDFDNCVLRDSVFHNLASSNIRMTGCALTNVTSQFQYWIRPSNIYMENCDVKGTNHLWQVGRFNIGRMEFLNTTFDLGEYAVVAVKDTRPSRDGDYPGTGVVSAEHCVLKSQLYNVLDKQVKSPSTRPVVCGWADCTLIPSDLAVGVKAAEQTLWTDLVGDDWYYYRDNTPIEHPFTSTWNSFVTSGDWSTAANWDYMPTPEDEVVFISDAVVSVDDGVRDRSPIAQKLTIVDGATLTVGEGHDLRVPVLNIGDNSTLNVVGAEVVVYDAVKDTRLTLGTNAVLKISNGLGITAYEMTDVALNATIVLDNGIAYFTEEDCEMSFGELDATLEMRGEDPILRNNGWDGTMTLGEKLLFRLVPSTNWSETVGRVRATSTYAKLVLDSGIRYEIDVSDLGENVVSQRFCLASARENYARASILGLPAPANVLLVGEGAEDFKCVFSLDEVDPCLGMYFTLIRKATPEEPPVESDGITTNAMANGWGYEIRGLGLAGNEVALVFTNTAATMFVDLPSGVASFRYLVVAGGGSGGGSYASGSAGGGGGGAGGLLTGTVESYDSANTLYVKVGAGGVASGNTANAGSRSVLSNAVSMVYSAKGGGKGGANGSAGGAGGSGGGGSGPSKAGGAGEAGQGYAGATSTATYGGGGGGAGGAGGGNDDVRTRGLGLALDITGSIYTYSRGGYGGKGGYTGSNATKYGEGGNGGGYQSKAGGNGYQGVVIIRYATGAMPVIDVPEPVIRGAEVSLDGDCFNIRIANAKALYKYGYRKSTTLAGLDSAPIDWLAIPIATGSSEVTLPLPRDPAEPAAFYKLVVGSR